MKAFVSYVIVHDVASNVQTFEYVNTIEDDFEATAEYITDLERCISRSWEGKATVLNFVILS